MKELLISGLISMLLLLVKAVVVYHVIIRGQAPKVHLHLLYPLVFSLFLYIFSSDSLAQDESIAMTCDVIFHH